MLKFLETVWRTAVVILLGLISVFVVALVAVWVEGLRIGEPKVSEITLNIRAYDAKLCDDPEYPLFISVVNKSSRTIERVYMAVEARRPDRSTNLVPESGGALDDDTIIKPSEGWGNCWPAPELIGLDPSESAQSLVWSVRVRSAHWADK